MSTDPTQSTAGPGDEIDRVARRVVTLEIADRILSRDVSAAAPVDHAALWRRLHRTRDMPVDLATERALNAHPAWREAYRAMLGARALATSPLAAAAAGGTHIRRRIGPYELTLEEAVDAGPHLVSIMVPPEAPAPAALEIVSGDLTMRIDLGPPLRGIIQLVLFPAETAHAAVHAALLSPGSGLYLL